ncbi:hypothetical protein BWR17_15240 [Phaeobacter inhibens]|nr:hypothetical protein BWR17_15240 [Phaeobacter inhibens]
MNTQVFLLLFDCFRPQFRAQDTDDVSREVLSFSSMFDLHLVDPLLKPLPLFHLFPDHEIPLLLITFGGFQGFTFVLLPCRSGFSCHLIQ